MNGTNQYTIEQFANKIRTSPNHTGKYDDWDDIDLTKHWIKEYPSSSKFLVESIPAEEEFKYNTNNKPEAAASELKRFLYGVTSGALEIPSFMTGTVSAMLDDRNMIKSADQMILNAKNSIEKIEADPNGNKRYANYLKEEVLPGLMARKQEISSMSSKETSRDWMYKKVSGATQDIKNASDKYLDDWIASDEALQAYLKWEEDNPLDGFDNLLHPDMLMRATNNLASSLALFLAPGGVARGAAFLGKTSKYANQLQKFSNFMGGSGSLLTMYAVEGGSIYNQAVDYLTDEYQYTNPDGDTITGIDQGDAMAIAALISHSYAGLSSIAERAQLNRLAKVIGIRKGYQKSMIGRMADNFLSKLPVRYADNGLARFTVNVADIGGTFIQEGMVEGIQGGLEKVHMEAIRQGYGVDTPIGFQEMLTQLGIQADEIGFRNLALPFMSEDESIRSQAWEGGAGFILPAAGRKTLSGAGSRAYKRFLRKAKDGNSVEVEEYEGNTVFRDGDDVAIAEGELASQFKNDLGEDQVNVTQNVSIDREEDYASALFDYATNGANAISPKDLADQFTEEEIKASPLKRMIVKHAKQRQGVTSMGGWEADLIALSGNKSIFRDLNAPREQYESFENLAVRHARNSVASKISNKLVRQGTKTKPFTNKSLAKDVIDRVMSDRTVISDDEVLNRISDRNLSNYAASIINKDKSIDFDVLTDKSFDVDAIIEKQLAHHEAKVETLAANRAQKLSRDQILDRAKTEARNNPVIDINDSSKLVTGKRLAAHLMSKIDPSKPRESNLGDILRTIEGSKGKTRMNNTNLGRLLKNLGIPYTGKDLQNSSKRASLSKEAANNMLDFIIDPDVVKAPKVSRVVTKKPKTAKSVPAIAKVKVKEPIKEIADKDISEDIIAKALGGNFLDDTEIDKIMKAQEGQFKSVDKVSLDSDKVSKKIEKDTDCE